MNLSPTSNIRQEIIPFGVQWDRRDPEHAKGFFTLKTFPVKTEDKILDLRRLSSGYGRAYRNDAVNTDDSRERPANGGDRTNHQNNAGSIPATSTKAIQSARRGAGCLKVINQGPTNRKSAPESQRIRLLRLPVIFFIQWTCQDRSLVKVEYIPACFGIVIVSKGFFVPVFISSGFAHLGPGKEQPREDIQDGSQWLVGKRDNA